MLSCLHGVPIRLRSFDYCRTAPFVIAPDFHRIDLLPLVHPLKISLSISLSTFLSFLGVLSTQLGLGLIRVTISSHPGTLTLILALVLRFLKA